MRFHTTHARDSSLRRLSRINRWMIAASVALTGLFTEAAALAFPGKSTSKPASAGKRAHAHHSHRAHSSTSRSTTAPHVLHPPESAPRATVESSAPAEAERSEAPAEEPAPERTPAEEPAAPEPEIAHESAPEPAPERESAPPVVSGGS
jgi:hypothetical protein